MVLENVYRAGATLQDMEMVQIPPTSLKGSGVLITEGARGEGGYLVNGNGERFMERYAPNAKDLASRDVVSRAIYLEVHEGRGCGPQKDHVLLKLEHLGEEVIAKRLPGIRDMVKTFLHFDPVNEPIPVYPTAHYTMGGIPTNRHGQVVVPEGNSPEQAIPGLYAVGECACVSVHGANRLGGNSLLDIVVFGRAAGNHISDYLKQNRYHRPKPQASIDRAMARLARWDRQGEGESIYALRDELKLIMEKYCGVFRNREILTEGVAKVQELARRVPEALIKDHSKVFNTNRIEALELENLVELGLATVTSALARQERRGAHSRTDYPQRDDLNWLKHSLYFREGGRMDFKPVRMKPLTVESFPPKARVY